MPGEGIEPPTFGLQNRCSTAELARLDWVSDVLGREILPFIYPIAVSGGKSVHASFLDSKRSLASPKANEGRLWPPLHYVESWVALGLPVRQESGVQLGAIREVEGVQLIWLAKPEPTDV